MADSKRAVALGKQLDARRLEIAPQMIHDLSVSMASFIAEIDKNSADVAAYIEQRLRPIIPMMRTDERVRAAVETMARDGRKLVRK